MVEMKVINLRDWDLFWASHSKRNTDKLEYVGAKTILEARGIKSGQV